jgi:SAM-dependent methyltransferase
MTLVPETAKPSNPSGTAIWDEHADWWKRTFTKGADPEYDLEIIPIVVRELAACSRILDIGCGEGQVARALMEAGASSSLEAAPTRRVIGLDPAFAQLGYALQGQDALDGLAYVQAAGEALPFADDTFDGAFCCLSIEHADDADLVLEEAARVLCPGGRFLLLINHPMYQGPESGFIDDQILGERYWRVGPYLVEQVSVEEVDSNVSIPFAHRPLHRYINPLAERDVVMTAMFEPPPLPEFLTSSIAPELEGTIPRLLVMRFDSRPSVPAALASRTAMS